MYPPFRPKLRWLKYWIYRIRHGFFPSDCWNLDHEIAVWLVPRLKYFRATSCSYPYMIEDKEATSEDWDRILDEMILGFELKIHEWDSRKDSDGTTKHWLNPDEEKLVTRAFSLLGEYGQHLWD